jgi:hypothetical protein
LGHMDSRRNVRRFHKKDVEISERAVSKRIDVAAIIYLDRPDAEGCGSSTGKTHVRVRLFPSHELFQDSSDALEPDLRIIPQWTPASQFNRTAHQDYIHQLD